MANGKVNYYGGKHKNSLWRKIKLWFRLQRNKFYRRLYVGKGGVLHNGVAWRYELPNHWQDKGDYTLWLRFYDKDVSNYDPRSRGNIRAAFNQVRGNKDSEYESGLRMHAETLKNLGLVPAEPDDPKGFYVKFS